MIYVGIDNANAGAITIFSQAKNCLGAVSWKVVTRNKKKKFLIEFYHCLYNVEKSYLCDKNFVQLAIVLSNIIKMYNCENLSIAIEDVFVRNNIKTCITLAKNAAMVTAILEKEFNIQISWVLPSSWRANLNMKKQKRKNAKADSLYYIPMMAKGLDTVLEKLGRLDHITDSAGIALYLIDENRRSKIR